MSRRSTHRRWLAALLGLGLALTAAASPAPPSEATVRHYTVPLIKARLRLPESLQDLQITHLAPTADDPARFTVRLSFKAKTPFGSLTPHSAAFLMKRGASGRFWVVTAE